MSVPTSIRWQNGPDGGTPLTAAQLNEQQDWIDERASAAEYAATVAVNAAADAVAPTDAAIGIAVNTEGSQARQAVAGVAQAHTEGAAAVRPPLTVTGGADPASDTHGAALRDILRRNARYNLNSWWEAMWASQDAEEYLDFGGVGEHQVRPVASAAYGVAALLHTGTWDDTIGGVTQAVARARTVRWVKSLAHRHRATTVGGWGRNWQSGLWSSLAGMAAWLVWADLDDTTRGKVVAMVVDEADNPNWRAPVFWKNATGTEIRAGDSAAEEMAWQSMIWQVAVAMMPRHTNAHRWRSQLHAFMVAAHSMPADVGDVTPMHGQTVGDFVNGWNVNPNGTVINHNLVHPDYMATVSLSLHAAVTASLSGETTPRAAIHNAAKVWAAFTTVNFTTGEGYAAPGGTIYVPGSADLYYPQGNDWSDPGLSTRVMDKAATDVMVSALGLDAGAAVTAATWAERHLGTVTTLQARATTGQVYQAAGEDTYATREQWISMNAAIAWMTKWAVAKGLHRGDDTGRTAPAGRLRTIHGTSTLTSPTTSVAAETVPYGVTFQSAPTIVVGSAITSGGIVVDTSSVSVATTQFGIRYRATAAVGSNVTVPWVAVGVV